MLRSKLRVNYQHPGCLFIEILFNNYLKKKILHALQLKPKRPKILDKKGNKTKRLAAFVKGFTATLHDRMRARTQAKRYDPVSHLTDVFAFFLHNAPTSAVWQTTEPIPTRQAASIHGLSIKSASEQEEQTWSVKKVPLKRGACYPGWDLCTYCFGAK